MKFSRATRCSLVAIGAASLALAAGVAPASAAPTVSDLTITKPVDKPSNVLLTSLAPADATSNVLLTSPAPADATPDVLFRKCTPGTFYPTVLP